MSAWYAYAVVPASFDALDGPGVLRGIDDGAVEVVCADGLGALVSAVGIGDVCDHEGDLDRLEPRIRAHQRVVDRAFTCGPVVPFRFGTVFRSAEVLMAWMQTHRLRLEDALARSAGVAEWVVTVTTDDDAACVDSVSGSTVSHASGADYLRARAAERAEAENRRQAIVTVADELHNVLSETARAAELRAPAADSRACVVLRGHYVVERGAEDIFAAVLAGALRDRPQLAMRGELSGPWPLGLIDDAQ